MKKIKEKIKIIITLIITFEARLVLGKYKPKIVAVTGNVGKTSTKDAIYTVFSNFFRVGKSQKSFNSEIGLPLAILGLNNGWSNPFFWILNVIKGFILFIFPCKYPEWLVLEIGADKPGDIKKISEWIRTDVVVLTRIPDVPVHIENFLNRKELVKEKSYLLKTLKKGGAIVFNGDDPSIVDMVRNESFKKINFGFGPKADILLSDYGLNYKEQNDNHPIGIRFKVGFLGKEFPVRSGNVFGKQSVYSICAALATGLSQDLNFVKMIEALGTHEPTPGRFNVLEGIRGSLIIDDTYNSSPAALEMALSSFSDFKGKGKKICVLGDMLELGDYSSGIHREIGKKIPSVCDRLFVVGEQACFFAEGAMSEGMNKESIFYFKDAKEAISLVREEIKKGDIVLVKGSQGMRMERVVSEIIKDTEKREENLVRQDSHWLSKK